MWPSHSRADMLSVQRLMRHAFLHFALPHQASAPASRPIALQSACARPIAQQQRRGSQALEQQPILKNKTKQK